MLLSIVIPCYNSEKTIRKVVELSMKEISAMEGWKVEFILVNDYSRDRTMDEIWKLAGEYPNVRGINLSRNFGQHNAIMAGLNYAAGDYIMGMDDDLQTHPSHIPAFIRKMDEGYDIVFGVFKKRKFSFMKNLISRAASFVQWHMVKRPKGIEASNYWCCRKYVKDEVIRYKNYNLYLQMLFFRTTSYIADIEIEHFARQTGTSNYTFRKAFRLFLGVLNYSIVPLRASSVMGTIFSTAGFIGAMVVLIRKIIYPDIAIGWSSLMCAMLVLFGITFLMLGIMGEYIGNLILDQGRTPQYIVRDTVNFETCPGRDLIPEEEEEKND